MFFGAEEPAFEALETHIYLQIFEFNCMKKLSEKKNYYQFLILSNHKLSFSHYITFLNAESF